MQTIWNPDAPFLGVRRRSSGIADRERQILTDIRDHEIAHVDFYRAKLGSSGIPKLEFNFR